MKPVSPIYYTLSPLQEQLLANLVKLRDSDSEASCWLPYDINNVDRFDGFVTKAELTEALRSMELKGLVEGVRIPYCGFRQFRITEYGAGQARS